MPFIGGLVARIAGYTKRYFYITRLKGHTGEDSNTDAWWSCKDFAGVTGQ